MAKRKFVPQPAIDRAGRGDGRRPILVGLILLILGGLLLTRGALAQYLVSFRLPQTDGTIAIDDRLLSGPVVNQQVTTSNVIVEARPFDPDEDPQLAETLNRAAPTAADDCLT